MSAAKQYFSRAEWIFLLTCAVLAVVLTVWFPFPSYFLVEAEAEQVSVVIDPDSALEWNFGLVELKPDEGKATTISGTVAVRSKDPVIIRRIEKGALKISLPEGSELSMTKSGDLQSIPLPANTFPATLVVAPEQISALVLPISGNIRIGRSPEYVQNHPARPVLLSGSVGIQTRAIDGRSVVQTTDQKMYMGDALFFQGAANGNGLLRVSDSPGMKLFFAINAKQACIQRFGSPKPIVVQSSFVQRITGDKALTLVWATFIFLAGLLFFRRSLLDKK